MTKQWVKIIILFILIIIIFIGGWFMYKRLEYKKESYDTNIYDYIPSQIEEVFNINKEYNLNDIYVYDSEYTFLVNALDKKYAYPLVLCKDNKDRKLLLVKIHKYEESEISDYIKSRIALPFQPEQREYKGEEIVIYPLHDDQFLVYAYFKGILAISKSYGLIEEFLDTEPENSFFYSIGNVELIDRKIANNSISMFAKLGDKILALDYKAKNDIIDLQGYIFDKQKNLNALASYDLIPYLMTIPENLCIEGYEISEENNIPAIRIVLNKMY